MGILMLGSCPLSWIEALKSGILTLVEGGRESSELT